MDRLNRLYLSEDSMWLSLDSTGAPVAAWFEGRQGEHNVVLKRKGPSGWAPFAAPIEFGENYAFQASMAMQGDTPLFAYHDEILDAIRVLKWDGAQWSEMGAPVTDSPRPGSPEIAVSPAGDILLGFMDYEPYFTPTLVNVKRWTGSAWETMGTPLPSTTGGFPHAIRFAFASDGTPWLTYGMTNPSSGPIPRSYRFIDGEWQPLPDFPMPSNADSVGEPTLRMDAQDRGVLSCVVQEYVGGDWPPGIIQVQRSDGSAWELFGENGVSGERGRPRAAALALLDGTTPVLAFTDETLHVRRWSGSDWTAVGQPLMGATGLRNREARRVMTVLGSGHQLHVIWSEGRTESTIAGPFDLYATTVELDAP